MSLNDCDHVAFSPKYLLTLFLIWPFAEVATAAVKFPKKKWVNFFCIDASDFLCDVTNYCVTWRKDFIFILDTLAKQYLLEAETLLSELKVNV